MIAKHVPMRAMKKSSFSSLIDYLSDSQGKQHRVADVTITNCASDNKDDAIAEITATQQLNKRAKSDKTYHLIVSFRAGENPSKDTLVEIEKRICSELGFDEHQRISVVHNDTDNLHMHIAINKIHPEKLTIKEPYYPHKTLSRVCGELESEFGLQVDNHMQQQTQSEGRAKDMERHSGVESLLSYMKRQCVDEMKAAKSWDEIHNTLHKHGLIIVPRGNGLIIKSREATIKASTLAREFSKQALEKKLGVYVAKEPTEQQAQGYKKEPRINEEAKKLYEEYKQDQINRAYGRKQSISVIKNQTKSEIESVKRMASLRRLAIKKLPIDPLAKKMLFRMVAKAQKRKMAAIHNRRRQAQADCYARYKRQTWADWVRAEATKKQADALKEARKRDGAQSLTGSTISGEKIPEERLIFASWMAVDSVTKNGTIIYNAGTGQGAIRDDGKKIAVEDDASIEAVRKAMHLSVEKYGDKVVITGTPTFSAQAIAVAVRDQMQITFADPELESRRQKLIKEIESGRDGTITSRETEDRRRNSGRTGGIEREQSTTEGRAYTAGNRSGASQQWGNGANRARTTAATVGNQTRTGAVARSEPPPTIARNNLRDLSSVQLVRIEEGNSVLLQNNVRSDVESQTTKQVDALRQSDRAATAFDVVDIYIKERAEKRNRGISIPLHLRYNVNKLEKMEFRGLRQIDGKSLVLLRRDGEESIYVLAINQQTANRLKKHEIGKSVTIDKFGTVKTKGRTV